MESLKPGKKTLEERLEELKARVEDPKFFENSSKSSESNYWVFDYDPKDELTVRAGIRDIQKSMENILPLQVFDLYEIMIEYLKSKNFLERTFKMEEKRGIEGIGGAIGRALCLATGSGGENRIVEYLVEHANPNSTIFFTGVGKCFPILKGREVFSLVFYNLPRQFYQTPLILFYPGVYTELELKMFGEVKEDNYYRARRIVR